MTASAPIAAGRNNYFNIDGVFLPPMAVEDNPAPSKEAPQSGKAPDVFNRIHPRKGLQEANALQNKRAICVRKLAK